MPYCPNLLPIIFIVQYYVTEFLGVFMEIVSEIINIPACEFPSTEYIESELQKKGIKPLRWAIVKISKDYFAINCAYDKIMLD